MSLDELAWVIARGAGMTAFVLLSAAVAVGLILSLRTDGPGWSRALTTEVHRRLTLLALGMTGLHLATLLADAESGIVFTDLLVPFAAGYRPLATGLGVIALAIVLITWVTTLMRTRLGTRRWQALHRLAILAFVAAIAHGVLAGTDRATPWAVFVWVLTGVGVTALFLVRITSRSQAPRAPVPAPGPAPQPPRALPPLVPRRQRPAGPLPPLPAARPPVR